MKPFLFKLGLCFWLINSTLHLYSQTAEQTLGFADSLFKQQAYEQACKEYQRILVFCSPAKNLIYRRLGNCYFAQNLYMKALENYNLAALLNTNDSLRRELLIDKANCYIRTSNFQFALVELYEMGTNLSRYFSSKQNFYLGVSYFGLEDYRLAEQCFIQSIDNQDSISIAHLKKLFVNKKSLYRPNPQTARLLSLVSGLGQFYAGDIKNGFNSMILCGALLYAGVRMTQIYTFLDAILVVSPWFQRYYVGGIKNAGNLAYQRLSQNRQRLFLEVLSTLEKTK